MIPQLDLEAPIIPGQGLGNFELGANIGEYHRLVGLADMTAYEAMHSEGRCRRSGFQLSGFQAIYSFPQLYELDDSEFDAFADALDAWHAADKDLRGDLPAGQDLPVGENAVEVIVDVRDGVIVGLFALSAYRGTLLDGIRTGMTYAEVRAFVPGIDWWVNAVGQVIDGVDGTVLHFDGDEIDVTDEEREGLTLGRIGVFLSGRTETGYVGS